MAQALDSRYTAHTSGRLLDLGSGGVPWKDHLLELEQEQGISGEQALLYVIYTDQVPSLCNYEYRSDSDTVDCYV